MVTPCLKKTKEKLNKTKKTNKQNKPPKRKVQHPTKSMKAADKQGLKETISSF
jgi:hypothetical protein